MATVTSSGGADAVAKLEAVVEAQTHMATHAEAQPCAKPTPGCSPAQSAALTASPGVIFSGSMDGHVRAYSAENGAVLWDFDTLRDFDGVNGHKGRGGSIDGPGAVIANGMLYINSGYARFGGMGGNVLLAFGID